MKRLAVLMVAATFVAPVLASSSAFSVYGTASFTNINSVDAQGDPDNVLGSWIATGGGNVTAIRVTGQLTEINTGTYASEARVRFSAGAGQSFTAFNFQASTVGSYTGTIAVGPSTINVTPFTLANSGTVNLEWFESYQDDQNLPEQRWDNVSYEFGANTITNGGAALGTLPADGITHNTPGVHVAGGLDFYTFTIGGVNNPADYLNISMLAGAAPAMTDTEIALYDSAGNFIATSDDNGPGLFSELSYGAADPLAAPDLLPGSNGLTLPAGTYTLVTGGYNTTFGATIGSITPGTNAGNYTLGITYFPEPASFAILALGALGLIRRR